MSEDFKHTVSNLILVTNGGIVIPILWIVGVQFTETVTEVKSGNYLVSSFVIWQLDNCGWHVSILLPYGTEFNIGNVRRYSAPNIVDSRCAVY